ncbi:MAG: sensor histidine kinase [Bacteroidales bacterium]|nr:sensor histidine kinase [Bacteroidales bacterium]MCM1415968.1 sensor histidine kinase [bacterium]MCM1422763.1 sensor histidine kinase [bacterium]
MAKRKSAEADYPAFHMKQFSALDVQEKERQRIARDLHDSSLQNLTHLVHKVELTSLYMDQDPIKAKLELATIESGLRKVIDDIRNRIYDLRPMTFDDLGLREALFNIFSVMNQDGRFEIHADIDEIEDDFSEEEKNFYLIMIYHIIKECVQNAIKHSGGNQIEVSLKKTESDYRIRVKDNGTGFDVKEAAKKGKHFGLLVVQERVFLLGGEMRIDTQSGTTVEINIIKK